MVLAISAVLGLVLLVGFSSIVGSLLRGQLAADEYHGAIIRHRREMLGLNSSDFDGIDEANRRLWDSLPLPSWARSDPTRDHHREASIEAACEIREARGC